MLPRREQKYNGGVYNGTRLGDERYNQNLFRSAHYVFEEVSEFSIRF